MATARISGYRPGLVDMAIQRLGSSGQRTDDAAAVRRRDPTLFAPSPHASGVHGPFGAESRRFSTQMWLNRRRLTGWGAVATAALVVALVVLTRFRISG